MKIQNSIPAVFKIVSFIFLMTLTAACDKNFVNPVDWSNNVAVEFSAESSSITLGEGTTLHWSISDPDGAVETVNFSGGGEDHLEDLIGNQNVSPTESTVYYVTVSDAEGDILKSAQVKVQVLDESGKEIRDGGERDVPVVETLCADTLDNDEDGFIDCLDTDCAKDVVVCTPESESDTEGSFTSGPTVISTGDTICLGDSVQVTWTSDFDGVAVSDTNGGSSYFTGEGAAAGTYAVAALRESSTTVTLKGFTGYIESAPQTVTITTSDDALCDPEFVGQFSSIVYPSNTLIKGESYALLWSSNNVDTVLLDGESVELNQEDVVGGATYTANSDKTHTFQVWDNQTTPLSITRKKSVTVKTFTEVSQPSLAADVSKVLPGEDAATAYIISGAKVIKATNYLSEFEVVLDTSTMDLAESTLTGYAVTSNGKTFVSTTSYIYLIEETTAKSLGDFTDFNDFTFNFVHAVGENVIVGSSKYLLKLDTAGDCDDGDGDPNDNDGERHEGVCILQINLSGEVIGGKTTIQQTGDYKQVFKKYGGANSGAVFMITENGVFISSDGGASFSSSALSTAPSLKGGSWSGVNGGFVWSDTTLYDYNRGSFEIVEGLTSEMTGGEIYYANFYAGRLFVATANGVYVKNRVGWSQNPVFKSSKVEFLTFKNGVQVKNNLAQTEHSVVLLTNTGSTATVTYKNSVKRK